MLKSIAVATVLGLSTIAIPTLGVVTVAFAADCVAKNNLSEKADPYISRCRKASIRKEFPSEHLNDTLGDIQKGKSASEKKAWKLLNDKRFAKT